MYLLQYLSRLAGEIRTLVDCYDNNCPQHYEGTHCCSDQPRLALSTCGDKVEEAVPDGDYQDTSSAAIVNPGKEDCPRQYTEEET